MELTRKLFDISWRLAIITLPWQTRIFREAELAGWPWEQGRLSFYASWLLVSSAVLLGLTRKQQSLPADFKRNIFWLLSALAGVTLVAMPYPTSGAIQWWAQIVLLSIFFVVLFKVRVGLDKFLFWLSVGLIPHALMGVGQFLTQEVVRSKWLGMAGQDPVSLGVSVVQTQAGRYLRAYGGLPHPNIFGGWMSFGLLIALWLMPVKNKIINHWSSWGWRLMVGLFSAGLFYSFSRSAWLAFALGWSMLLISGGFRNLFRINKYLMLPILILLGLSFLHHELVFTRLKSLDQRLEVKSVVTRMQTIRDGVWVFQNKPWFGTGPNSELPVLARLKNLNYSPAPLETPHMVWLLILVNYGIAGGLFVFGFSLFILRRLLDKWPGLLLQDRVLVISLGAVLAVIGSLDHYLWTTWSGQVLAGWFFFSLLTILYAQEPK